MSDLVDRIARAIFKTIDGLDPPDLWDGKATEYGELDCFAAARAALREALEPTKRMVQATDFKQKMHPQFTRQDAWEIFRAMILAELGDEK